MPLLPALGNEQDHKVVVRVRAHWSANSVSPATPAMCSSSAAASASNGMCETAAYQLAPFYGAFYFNLV